MKQCESKLKLLRTAHELISRQSYGSVGVDQICEQSGVKKGSFYHFFRSKSELTVAAYEYHWDQLRATLDRVFSVQKTPVERLDSYFSHIYKKSAWTDAVDCLDVLLFRSVAS
jgi:TetR/AcrR family transcriptional repressor of nem operon